MSETLESTINEALALVARFQPSKGEYISIDAHVGGATVSYFPGQDRREAQVRLLLTMSRKIAKGDGGTVEAVIGSVTFRMFGALECKQTGTKIIERKKVVETDEVERIERPVYSCRLPFEVE